MRGRKFKSDYELDLVEAQVAKQISDFLEWRQWRKIRNNVGLAMSADGSMTRFGEPGMADMQFVRYIPADMCDGRRGVAIVIWVETKRPGADMSCRCRLGTGKTCRNCNQKRWRDNERGRGAIVIVADRLSEFEKWYETNFSWLHASGTGTGQLRLIP